jgi:hypothetical protein
VLTEMMMVTAVYAFVFALNGSVGLMRHVLPAVSLLMLPMLVLLRLPLEPTDADELALHVWVVLVLWQLLAAACLVHGVCLMCLRRPPIVAWGPQGWTAVT